MDGHGWRIRESLGVTTDIDTSRVHRPIAERVHRGKGLERPAPQRLVQRSKRELPFVCGRTVVTQGTAFSNLPTARGLFAFSTMEEIEEAIMPLGDERSPATVFALSRRRISEV